MPGSYTSLHYHLVTSTKGRQPLLSADLTPRLYQFIGGIIRSERGSLLAIGGMPDHVHLLIRWRPDESVSSLMRGIKTRSSKWLHDQLKLRNFAWQEGYSAFTVSQSGLNDVQSYIECQEKRHRERTFEDELRALLRAHGIDFEEQYVFG